MSFTQFYNKQMPFYAIKTRSSKIQKINLFPKGSTRGMRQKLPFFNLFFLGNIVKENVFYDTLKRKNAFLGHKNK